MSKRYKIDIVECRYKDVLTDYNVNVIETDRRQDCFVIGRSMIAVEQSCACVYQDYYHDMSMHVCIMNTIQESRVIVDW